MMKKTLRLTIIVLWFLLTFLGFFGFWLSGQKVVPIMMYHDLGYEEGRVVNTIAPVNFIRHMNFLKKNKYNVISLQQLVEAIECDKTLPRKSIVITFDDGKEDNYTSAFPILLHHGFPATFFVIVDKIGEKGYLTWKQVKEMEKHGMTIASHTRTHPYLPDLFEEELIKEIVGSKKILEKKLGHPIEFLAYPTGGFSERVKEIVKKAGYKAACTTNRGYDRLNKDLYELKRIRFGDEDNSAAILFVKLSGFYNTFRKAKDPY